MYVIQSLRLNKFKPQPVMSPRRLFELFGLKAPRPSEQTAEDLDTVVPMGARKTQLLDLGVKMAEKAAAFVDDPNNTKPLDQIRPKDL